MLRTSAPGRSRFLVRFLLLLPAAALGCGAGRPGYVRGGGWEVSFESPAPDDPEDDSLYLELLESDALEEGFVDLALQLHRMGPRLVRAWGRVTVRSEDAEEGGRLLGFRDWRPGWYFERCRRDVEYEVVGRLETAGVDYEVGVEPMGMVGRLLTGACQGAEDTGRLLVLRFELLRPGTVTVEVGADGPTGFETTARRRASYARTYGGTLTIRRVP